MKLIIGLTSFILLSSLATPYGYIECEDGSIVRDDALSTCEFTEYGDDSVVDLDEEEEEQ